MFIIVIGWLCALLWVIANTYVTFTMTATQMYNEFIDGQCNVGKIFANAFYSLAWLCKIIKILIK